jgi:hypothetical protein
MEDPIPFVQRIPRASGKVDAYFRHRPTGYRKRLHSPYGSDAMRAEVDAILASLAAVERAQTPQAGTVGQMLKAYAGAPESAARGSSRRRSSWPWPGRRRANMRGSPTSSPRTRDRCCCRT